MSARARLAVLIGFITAGALLGRTALGPRFEAAHLVRVLGELGASPLAAPVFVLLFGVGTTLLTPAVAFMGAAGVTWGTWPGWLIVWGAANLWSNVHFGVGRWGGGRALSAWIERRGAKWLRRELEAGGVLSTVMVRQLPLPFALVNLAAGASPMPWHRWLVGNALGLLPNCIVYTQLAASMAAAVAGPGGALPWRGFLAAGGVFVLAFVSRWLQRRRELRGEGPA